MSPTLLSLVLLVLVSASQARPNGSALDSLDENDFARKFAEKAKNTLDEIFEEKSQTRDAIVGVISNVASKKHEAVQSLVDKTKQLVHGFVGTKTEAPAEVQERSKSLVSNFKHTKENVADAVGAVGAVKQVLLEDVLDRKNELLTNLAEFTHDAVKTVIDTTTDIERGIVRKAESFVGHLANKKDAVVDAFINAAEKKESVLKNKFGRKIDEPVVVWRWHGISLEDVAREQERAIEEIAGRSMKIIDAIVEAHKNNEKIIAKAKDNAKKTILLIAQKLIGTIKIVKPLFNSTKQQEAEPDQETTPSIETVTTENYDDTDQQATEAPEKDVENTTEVETPEKDAENTAEVETPEKDFDIEVDDPEVVVDGTAEVEAPGQDVHSTAEAEATVFSYPLNFGDEEPIVSEDQGAFGFQVLEDNHWRHGSK